MDLRAHIAKVKLYKKHRAPLLGMASQMKLKNVKTTIKDDVKV